MLKVEESSSIVLVVCFLIFLASININAQDFENKIIKLDDKAVDNLKTAIKSENPGLRKSGIYFAGKYSVTEVSETLLEQLKIEEDPGLKILLVRVLFIIDDNKYINDIHDLAMHDDHPRVRRMASAVYSVMNINNSQSIVEMRK